MTTLIRDIGVVGVRGDPASTDVAAVEFDSRQVREGSLFCCVPGVHTDGHRYAAQAVERGATALLCDHLLDLDVTQACVAPGMVRPAMASVASAFFGHPSRALTMAGVTGTNGKTTVTHLIRSVLNAAGRPTGVIGTLDGARTTPEAPVLQGLLAGMRDDGRRAVAMEVSSHALSQHRVDGIVFDVAAFTNLSRDHLDHHRTMDGYFAAKARLFEPSRARLAVVNVDDRWGRRLADELPEHRVVRVQRSAVSDVRLSIGSSAFTWHGRQVTIPLSGAFNVDNALLAATVASSLGVDDDLVAEGLASVPPIPGRMEVVPSGLPFAAVIDYAHTPAGLDGALSAARELAGPARVICLFGCGGDRDRGKRPEMGAVAARRADAVVLTSDNPRSEDPMVIIDQIRAGIGVATELVVEPDRAEAIRVAVTRARPGDVVVVAGKGHETTQVIGGRELPFDDRDELARALAERSAGGAGDVDR
ncbi:MAG TPA: UDP-N-acetylmuramoyl-L-alanyl-D-glutamate--2,6-diaminopimelate ligase [Acidimicrobiales bacterium]|jgi:UDP-N-acetylmuramoyl-L-alanyl-D-glutamate--2,6-diaminopimelate ligase|nr:UDP-N-acetylmuramoyl-L-alanyl-D-glutamate--2,6-diaminopimelate ligase [Acidimicrobiales bacterium]